MKTRPAWVFIEDEQDLDDYQRAAAEIGARVALASDRKKILAEIQLERDLTAAIDEIGRSEA